MSLSLRDMLVVADIDGTLLDDELKLLDCNLETIRLFVSMGGRFTIASGRMPQSIANYPEIIELAEPAILCGGSIIYDYKEERAMKCETMPRLVSKKALSEIMKAYPRVGAVAAANDMHLYQINGNKEVQQFLDEEHLPFLVRPVEDIPPEWCKLLFSGPAEMLKDIAEYTAERSYPGAYFVSTGKRYYEMMPEEATKGNALCDLCGMLNIPIENTVVIGDYYNDIDMMKQAGYSVAMGNAPEDVKAQADEVTGTNQEGGVGQYLYSLIKKYG